MTFTNGGNATYSKISTSMPEFDMLENLLLQINPDFKLKDYKTIKSLVDYEEGRKSEYYGNGTYYSEYILRKDDLLEGLDKSGVVLSNKDLINLEEHFATLYLVQTEPAQTLGSKNKYK